jgi:hypothetical protein
MTVRHDSLLHVQSTFGVRIRSFTQVREKVQEVGVLVESPSPSENYDHGFIPSASATDSNKNSYVGQSVNCHVRNHELLCMHWTLARGNCLPWHVGLGLSVQTI